MKILLTVVYFSAAIICGSLTGFGTVVFVKLIGFGKVYPTEVTERPPAALYKELFMTQAYPTALAIHKESGKLKVSELLAVAATRSGFAHFPSDPCACVLFVMKLETISEFDRELIKEMNLTKYDTLQ